LTGAPTRPLLRSSAVARFDHLHLLISTGRDATKIMKVEVGAVEV
jgi:hypothetical protein